MSYFSNQKRGGISTSYIENQDSVAIILALEIMQNESIFSSYYNSVDGWSLMFEGNDDIEIISNNYCTFIQVKSKKVTPRELNEILDHFYTNLNEYKNKYKQLFFMISAFEGIDGKLKSFPEKLKEFRKAQKSYKSEIHEKILLELINEYSISLKYKEIIKYLYIDTRHFVKDDTDTKAIFVHNLRKAYFFKDIGDRLSLNIYKVLADRFSYERRNRGSIHFKEILNLINKEIKKLEFIADLDMITGYKKIDYGYKRIENNEYIKKLSKCQDMLKHNVFKEWRKAYLKEFLISLLIGNVRCPECGHPLMANLGGLNGIACPDCGFQPYLTLFLGCYCGEYVAIKTQPELSTEEIFTYIYEYFDNNHKVCPKCGKEYIDEFICYRILIAPVPYPFNNFDLKELYYKVNKR